MFCPVCNQKQISEETRFCSRCGFLLTGVSQLIANGGVLPQMVTGNDPNAISPRKKGVKRGALLLFMSFILVPLLAIITIAVGAEPFVVAAAAVLFGGGGLLRIIYALLFESKYPTASDEGVLPESFKKILPSKKQPNALPPQQSVPVSSYVPPNVGNWRDTNDLAAAPPSVTDPTTKLLQKDE
jgi:hypothetical protein